MISPNLVILTLKILVLAVTVLLIASIIALRLKKPVWHGRINTLFFALTMITVLGFEVVIRFIQPDLTARFSPEAIKALRIHLCFSIPATIVLPGMLYTGLKKHKKVHLGLALIFVILWIGTVVTGVIYLPHDSPE